MKWRILGRVLAVVARLQREPERSALAALGGELIALDRAS